MIEDRRRNHRTRI